jgi:hypothetical protein
VDGAGVDGGVFVGGVGTTTAVHLALRIIFESCESGIDDSFAYEMLPSSAQPAKVYPSRENVFAGIVAVEFNPEDLTTVPEPPFGKRYKVYE